ncbi:MAG: RNA methyltransferase [Planctomycetota bacterium]|nr:RNA methyltransferase [Planctomycetota bacterium]
MSRKRRIDQHRADADQREHRTRPELYLILDNIRSLTNVGSIFRAADGFGTRKIFLCGITPTPPRPEISKISLGAEESTAWEQMEDPAKAVRVLQNQGVTVLALEQTDTSIPIFAAELPHPLAIVVGHEVVGVDEQVLHLCDGSIEIPMFGSKHSHNVATATGVILSEVRRRWLSMPNPTPWEDHGVTSSTNPRTDQDNR